MKNRKYKVLLLACMAFFLVQCEDQAGKKTTRGDDKDKIIAEYKKTSGFASQELYGEHLVIIGGCNDCHTPKKMGPQGPVLDSFNMLSGHPANAPIPDIDRKMAQSKGLVITNDLTSWVGPWGVSFTANLTPDDTGIKNWTVDQFKLAIREGKFHGQANGRTLLPPMPWDMYRHMTDEELAAVFAYLKSLKPIENLVPAPLPPAN